MQRVIDIRNAVARHPDYRLRQPVTLCLNAGECVAITGRNGSGKTMLVEMLTGAHPLLPGGELTYDFSPSERRMACDNIRTVTFRDTYGTADGRYYHQLRWNQHDDPDPMMLLSSGELRRHILREAMQSRPRVLILDNPFIGLDVEARRLLAEELQRLKEVEGVLLVLVMSKTDDMPPCVTHVVEVKDGVVGEKRPLALTTSPNPSGGGGLQTHEYKIKRDYTSAEMNSPNPSEGGENDTLQACDFSPFTFHSSLFTFHSSRPVVRLHDVTIRYGARTILDCLNWTVNEGEHWALSGPNGSGKSTLLSILCADNPQAYANDVELFGHQRGQGESIWDIKRHIGYVSPELHRAYRRDLPAIEVVASGLTDWVGLYSKPRADQLPQCEKWMQRFGILHLRDRSFLRMSSGEQRMVLVVRAFVRNPDLLILDEPLHGLDMENRQLVRQVIDEYCSDPTKTLIMVTHYEEELPTCIDHRLELKPEK
jgi:molybdate transport system ATP-binding protein